MRFSSPALASLGLAASVALIASTAHAALLRGTIVSVNGDTISVASDGSTETYLLPTEVEIGGREGPGTVAHLEEGQTVVLDVPEARERARTPLPIARRVFIEMDPES